MMEELIDLLNYYGRDGYYHTMRNMAREAMEKYQNSAILKYYAALPLLPLRNVTGFIRELNLLKLDHEVGLAVNIALIYCSRLDMELFSEGELKEIDSQLTVFRKKAGEKALLHAANFFVHTGRYSKAREYADRLLKSYPNSPKGLSVRGWIELASDNVNRTQLALDYFTKSQVYFHDNIDSIFGQIMCLKTKAELTSALEAVNRLALQMPGSLLPLNEKAKVYMAACKWEEAQEVINVILRENSICLEALQLNAICSLCGNGSFNEAAVLLRKLYIEGEKSEPLNAGYFSENASLFSKICTTNGLILDETLRFAEKAVQLHQENATYLTQMGNQYLLKGKTGEAIKIFRNAMKTDEVSLTALIGLTKAHMIEGGSGLEQAFKNIKLLNEVHGTETSPEVMLMTAIINRCNSQQDNSKDLLSKAISKHLNVVDGMCIGAKYFDILDPDFLLNAACECLISIPMPCFSMNFVDEICLVSQAVVQPAINAIQHIIKVCPGMKKAHLLLAKAHFLAGNILSAVNVTQKLIEKVDANSSIAYLVLAQIYSDTGDIEQASSCLESGLSYDFGLGQHLLHYLVSARVLREHGDLAACITTLEKGISMSTVQERACSYKMLSLKDEVTMHLELAESYHRAGNENEAKNVIKDAYEKFKGTSEVGHITLSAAAMTFKEGDSKEAVTLLSSILPRDPYYVRGCQQLAEFYLNQKNYEMYVACYKNIIDWCGETCQSYLLYGSALMHIQEPNKAIEAYEQVLCKEPSNTLAMYRMGHALIKAHQYGKAIGFLKEGVGNVERPQMRVTLAQLLLRMKQCERAERMLVKELEEERKGEDQATISHHLQVLLLLAKIYAQLDKDESSVAALSKALEVQFSLLKRMGMKKVGIKGVDVSNVCTMIASLYVGLGNYSDALRFLKSGLSHAPDDIAIMEVLLSLYMQLGDHEQCHSVSSSILKIDPCNKSAFITTADLAFRRLDFDSAAFHLEQLLEHHHYFWKAFAKLIEVRRRAGRLDEVPASVRGDALSDSGTPAGLAYCRGLHSWYLGKPAAALHHFHYAKRDSEWAWDSIHNMVEIYLYPDGDCLPGSTTQGGTKAADDGLVAAIGIAKNLLSEQQKLCQNKEQHLQWRLLDMTTLLASREKQNVEMALRELSAIATAPDSRVDHVGVAVCLATAHILLRQGSRARNHLKRVARNQWCPDDADNLERVWLLLADHYYSSGKNESAAELLQRTLQHNKSCIKAQELLGQVMEKAQSFSEAVTSYENAWKMGMKTNVSVGYKLAHAQMKAKHYAEAIDVCHEVLKNYPNESRIKKDILEKCRFSLRT